jgi:protein SCO1/2
MLFYSRVKRLLTLVALTILALSGCRDSKTDSLEFFFTDITGANFARQFELDGPDGQRVSLEYFRNHVVAVFFGFTQCPDVCPTTLADLNMVADFLGEKSDRFKVAFITVDPLRDQPELLRKYVSAFNPNFVGLTGSPEEISRTAKEFKVTYQKVKGQSPTTYSVDHTAATFIFDKQGLVRLFVPYGADPSKIAMDIEKLLDID